MENIIAHKIASLMRDNYDRRIKVFDVEIPHSIRAAEISTEGKSIYTHNPKCKVSAAYCALT